MLAAIDIAIVVVYAITIFTFAFWVSRNKDGKSKDSQDYFLAGKALPWWAIGASLIAANISAEQIIGMSGSGYAIGLAIASYEWMAAATLILVAKYFLPVFLKNRIYTMPQFLERRYGHSVRLTLAVFWLGVYIFVNLTAVLWLGALAMSTVTGIDITLALIGLGVFAAAYSLYGGLKAVALTDVIQVILLVLGGLLISWIALDRIADGNGPLAGFAIMTSEIPGHFNMILSPGDIGYGHLPGLSVLIGGLWIMNLSYWGFNQYIIQRALAAKDLREAQKGVLLAAFLKLLMPLIVVLPGIAAVMLAPDLDAPDQAYPTVMTLLPDGIKGLVFAALLAAIVSSLASMMNSISTIFTMDIYAPAQKGETPERRLVLVGRLAALAAIVLAMLTARPLLGNFDQAFQYIQEFTGFFTPGIVVIFLLGLFWKRASTMGALVAAIGSAALSLLFYFAWPSLPFMDRVGLVFLICLALAVAVSLVRPSSRGSTVAEVSRSDFSTTKGFNLASAAIILILAALYATWW